MLSKKNMFYGLDIDSDDESTIKCELMKAMNLNYKKAYENRLRKKKAKQDKLNKIYQLTKMSVNKELVLKGDESDEDNDLEDNDSEEDNDLEDYNKATLDYIEMIRNKYSDNELRPMKRHDYTLTKNEMKILKKSKDGKYIFCYCCDCEDVSRIINRPFISCGTCYCCVCDDPFYDKPDLCFFVNDKLTKRIAFLDEDSPCKFKKLVTSK